VRVSACKAWALGARLWRFEPQLLFRRGVESAARRNPPSANPLAPCQAAVGHPLTVYGKGGQTRGFLDIRDTGEGAGQPGFARGALRRAVLGEAVPCCAVHWAGPYCTQGRHGTLIQGVRAERSRLGDVYYCNNPTSIPGDRIRTLTAGLPLLGARAWTSAPQAVCPLIPCWPEQCHANAPHRRPLRNKR
jgi:hypothetical protein